MGLTRPGAPTPSEIAHQVGVEFVKSAGTPTLSYGLAGRLYISKSGWGLLSVPNAFVRGVFDALDEPGVELPPGKDGKLNAHISVLRPEDVEAMGGADKITERGHMFRYTLGQLKEVVPDGWDGMSKVWIVDVNSPALEQFRKSYGLTGLPHNNKFRFHITVGVRRSKVLQNSAVVKR